MDIANAEEFLMHVQRPASTCLAVLSVEHAAESLRRATEHRCSERR